MTDPTTPTPPATEGQAGSEELIPGRDFCPLDGEPLKMVIQAKGKPTLYIHADGFTWHPDASEQIKIRPVADILSQLRSGSPQHLTRPELPEHYAQPSVPAARTDGAALDVERVADLIEAAAHTPGWSRPAGDEHWLGLAREIISAPVNSLLGELRRELDNAYREPAAVGLHEAIALVEAAQARLAEPVRGGGSDG